MNNSKHDVKNCLIINLDNREDLWNSLEKFRRKWNIYGKICDKIPGVNFKTQTHVVNDFLKSNRLNLNGAGFRHTKEALLGELGCYMGHFNSWKYVVDNKLDCCLILEDGINFLRSDFENLLIDKNLDVLFINREMTMDYNKNFTGYGLQGYVITQKGAQNLMEKCFVLSLPIDLQIRSLCNSKEIQGDTINTPFVKRNNNRVSSIDGIQLGNNANINNINLNDKQNQNSILQRLFYNLLEKNVNLDDYI
jgi:GR25 family glycosyltransferase involved in LPS biosynthesis